MKYVVVLCDGMADTPSPLLKNRTPMMCAHKPCMDELAAHSEVGLVRTVPDGMAAGSDVANLSVLGYDPTVCYTGRSPLEAANIGVDLTDEDVAFRCNLVTLSEEEPFEQKTILDYCAGDIPTAQADVLIKDIQEAFGGGTFDFYTGTAYRHCTVWHGGSTDLHTTPPHDITGRIIGSHLPPQPLLDMMTRSFPLLRDHPVNRQRIRDGLAPANAIWLWGQGKRPQLEPFNQRFGVRGGMISAVDLLKGIGRVAGMEVYDVEGATGYVDTNYEGKADAAFRALESGVDLAYIHVEAPDECGHRGEVQNKIKAIEDIDRRILAPLLARLPQLGTYRLLVAPDHPTPLAIRTHTAAPVPYLLYASGAPTESGVTCFTEETAAQTGVFVSPGYTLMNRLLGR